ncbi:ABC transporter permease [Mesorhizobium sp. ANAO-SY3R2]|uniref:ABC transporter permease n=1 Tax=Mesorhizobium sp. ANAO-SY3R2 TaxID=3166644 RepID=UPI00366C144F
MKLQRMQAASPPRHRERQLWLHPFSGPTGGIAAATIVLFLVGGIIAPNSLGSDALAGMLPFAAVLALVALGQTLVIQQGGIDLSVPGVVSISAVVVSYLSQQPHMSVAFALFCTFTVAAMSGLINGLLVSRVNVAPIVATIGVNALLYGVNVRISGGTPVAMPGSVSAFSNATIFGITQLAAVVLLAAAALIILIKATPFGRRFKAVGSNARAARAAGITASRYQIFAYVCASMLYASGGIVLGGLMQLPSPQQGDAYLMPSIAAVVLGGTSLLGGRGNFAATVIAALFLTQLQQLVRTTGAGIGIQYVFQGAAILVGVGIYSLNFRKLARGVLG